MHIALGCLMASQAPLIGSAYDTLAWSFHDLRKPPFAWPGCGLTL